MTRNRIVIVLVVLGVFLLVRFGYDPTQKIVVEKVSADLPLELAWQHKTGDDLSWFPIIYKDLFIFLESNGAITALDLHDGSVVWRIPIDAVPPNVSSSTPNWAIGSVTNMTSSLLVKDLLVLSPNNEMLLALDPGTGEQVWQVIMPTATWDTPTIVITGGMVVVGEMNESSSGYLAGYNLHDGQFSWEIVFPARLYRHIFDCPKIPVDDGRILEHGICMIPLDSLLVIDPSERYMPISERIVKDYGPIDTLHTPIYADGFVFTNPSPHRSVHVLDTTKDRRFELPTTCVEDSVAKTATLYEDQVLVIDGCGMAYVQPFANLEE